MIGKVHCLLVDDQFFKYEGHQRDEEEISKLKVDRGEVVWLIGLIDFGVFSFFSAFSPLPSIFAEGEKMEGGGLEFNFIWGGGEVARGECFSFRVRICYDAVGPSDSSQEAASELWKGFVMRYIDYRDSIQKALKRTAAGMTWAELKSNLALPYDRPCPEWTKQLEQEIGLVRVKGNGRALVWKLLRPK